MELRGKRAPGGNVPIGDSLSVGQFRGACILECSLPVSGRIRFFLTHIVKKVRALDCGCAPRCPAPFAGLNEIEAPGA
jgi:hypothetical protein